MDGAARDEDDIVFLGDYHLAAGELPLERSCHDDPVFIEVAVPVGPIAGAGRVGDEGDKVPFVLDDAHGLWRLAYLFDDFTYSSAELDG